MTKHLTILFLLFSSCLLFAQNDSIAKDFSYVDANGNLITIKNANQLPTRVDTSFFRENISYRDLNPIDSSLVTVEIKNLREINQSEFTFEVIVSTQNKDEAFADGQSGKIGYHFDNYSLIFFPFSMKLSKNYIIRFDGTTMWL